MKETRETGQCDQNTRYCVNLIKLGVYSWPILKKQSQSYRPISADAELPDRYTRLWPEVQEPIPES
jgi:hypothetical protein